MQVYEEDDEEEDESPAGRRLRSRPRREETKRRRLASSSEEEASIDTLTEDLPPVRSLRRRAESPPASRPGRRSLRQRRNGVSYKDMDESSGSSSGEEEEVKVSVSKRRVVVDEDTPVAKQRISGGDENFQLVQGGEPAANRECTFCSRHDGEGFVGPFINSSEPQRNRQHYYFHTECLEANNHSFYSREKGKWLNIASALKKLQ